MREDDPRIADSGSAGGVSEGTVDDSPLSDLAREVDERRARRSSSPSDDLFEEVDVDEVDGESVWESLSEIEGDDETGADAGLGPVAGGAPDDDATRVEREDPGAPRRDHVVPKSAYCQRCRYISDPPELACGHDGTEIVEVVDSERFRVRGCPLVDADPRASGDEAIQSGEGATRTGDDSVGSGDGSTLLNGGSDGDT